MLIYSQSNAKRIIQISATTTSYLRPAGVTYSIHHLMRPTKMYWSGDSAVIDQVPSYYRHITPASQNRLKRVLEGITPAIRITERSIHLEYEA